MGKGRLEAFSDGVLAIIITIMVLELEAPEGATLDALAPLAPSLLSYVLSFIYVGIYWNNHHHLLQASRRVTGSVLWANLHLLFWLSLLPFATRWMGNNHLAPLPTMAYGAVLLASAVAYWLLQRVSSPPTAANRCCAMRWAATGKASCRRCSTWPASPPRCSTRGSARRCSRWWRCCG